MAAGGAVGGVAEEETRDVGGVFGAVTTGTGVVEISGVVPARGLGGSVLGGTRGTGSSTLRRVVHEPPPALAATVVTPEETSPETSGVPGAASAPDVGRESEAGFVGSDGFAARGAAASEGLDAMTAGLVGSDGLAATWA